MSLYGELSRRNVIRVAIAYAVASWVLLQIVDVISPFSPTTRGIKSLKWSC